MSRRARDLRLLPVVFTVWSATAIATVFPDVSGRLSVGLVALSLGGSVMLALRRLPAAAVPVCALVVAGTVLAGAAAAQVAYAEPSRAAVSALPVDGGRALSWELRVVGKVERSAHGWRFDAVSSQVTVGEAVLRTSAPLLVRAVEIPSGVDVGAAVSVRGTALRADAGARAVLIVHASEIALLSPPEGAFAAAASLRRGLHDVVSGLPQPAAGLIAGLAVGDTSGVTPELDEAMKRASLSHLTAVSGANCALVVGLSVAVGAALGLRRRTRLALGASVLVAFVVLVTPEPSVVRAAAMALIAMIAIVQGRAGAGVAVLGMAVIVLLILDPWLALSAGFVLSTVATAALLLLAGPLADGLSRWMPPPLALVIAVPLSAQLACGPVLVLLEPTVPVYGVLANLIAAPAAPAATVVGLLACVSTPIPVLAHGFAALAWLPAAWIAETAALVARLPWATAPWFGGLSGAVALTVVGATIVGAVHPAARNRPRLRAGAVLAIAAIAGAGIAWGPALTWLERERLPNDWTIVACDVGQGDAVLIRSSQRVALVDTGPDPEPLRQCLELFGIQRIDLLVLTHFDLDHRGGVPAVVGSVGHVIHGPVPDTAAAHSLGTLERGGARLTEVSEGVAGTVGAARWRVLWPPATAATSNALTGNDASVILEIDGGGVPRTLLLGDLSASPQIPLATRVSGAYEVVKVAHHGSADQYPRLYEVVRARLALLTVGDNTYGHPRKETLDILADTGARIARTDHSGAIAVWMEAGGLRFWRQRSVGGAE
ncbi:MAG: ComEC/Rec2 family competence protein [Candidatus Microbacterium phytovorans]|uniref:ComEC/Rec2 family competence protein n=1 Tax=Candidatus Microbacterium phytovorans TaxID=3121374 RepID=A0AAJ6B4T0_9MICO|nr:ComEC/Rec2 family competence protein [Microbacterium sp.]WEK14434.1 MAG: ComEC/Rec2 family competence protein [Microbacterium sp.]